MIQTENEALSVGEALPEFTNPENSHQGIVGMEVAAMCRVFTYSKGLENISQMSNDTAALLDHARG